MTNGSSNWIEVSVPGGAMGAFLALPRGGKGPGIVMLQEIFGVNAAMRAKAEEFAEAGYVVLVPDVFWRMQPRVDLGYSEVDRRQAFELMQSLNFPQAVSDIAGAYAALNQMEECTASPSFVGFCLGGKLAVLAAAEVGDANAVVSFYGVKLDENIEQIKTMKCPVSIHVGDQDSHIPMEVVAKLKNSLDADGHVDINVYAGAKHGFFNKARSDVYDLSASQKAWSRALEILPPPTEKP